MCVYERARALLLRWTGSGMDVWADRCCELCDWGVGWTSRMREGEQKGDKHGGRKGKKLKGRAGTVSKTVPSSLSLAHFLTNPTIPWCHPVEHRRLVECVVAQHATEPDETAAKSQCSPIVINLRTNLCRRSLRVFPLSPFLSLPSCTHACGQRGKKKIIQNKHSLSLSEV